LVATVSFSASSGDTSSVTVGTSTGFSSFCSISFPVASTRTFCRMTLPFWSPCDDACSLGWPDTRTSTRLFGVMKPLTPVTLSTRTDMPRMPSVMSSGSSPAPFGTSVDCCSG
jgi:hypothetical protein